MKENKLLQLRKISISDETRGWHNKEFRDLTMEQQQMYWYKKNKEYLWEKAHRLGKKVIDFTKEEKQID